MTDAEAWGVFGEMIAGAKCLPESYYLSFSYGTCAGLCAMLDSAYEYGLVDTDQHCRMEMQLRAYGANIGALICGHYWPEYEWKPRARACKEISRLILEGNL